jgi:hypothetical protein
VTAGAAAAQLTLWLQLASTLFMTGVIWYVQLVHYPLMRQVARDRFPDFHREHSRRTGLVVIGPMVVEAATAVVLVIPGVAAVPRPLAVFGLLLVLVLWALTFGVQVPLHRRLAGGFDEGVHRKLVAGNWIRTAAWSARSLLVIVMAAATG